MTGHGGWPLNVFLTPEGVPFYGGTYCPPADRQGMPAFPKVLEAVHTTPREINRDEVVAKRRADRDASWQVTRQRLRRERSMI